MNNDSMVYLGGPIHFGTIGLGGSMYNLLVRKLSLKIAMQPLTSAILMKALNMTVKLTLSQSLPVHEDLCSIILRFKKREPTKSRFATNQYASIPVTSKVIDLHGTT